MQKLELPAITPPRGTHHADLALCAQRAGLFVMKRRCCLGTPIQTKMEFSERQVS